MLLSLLIGIAVAFDEKTWKDGPTWKVSYKNDNNNPGFLFEVDGLKNRGYLAFVLGPGDADYTDVIFFKAMD